MARGNLSTDDYNPPSARSIQGIAENPPKLPNEPGSLIVLCGLPGAGKSTISAYWPDAKNICPDAYRAKAPNSAGEWDQSASRWAFTNAHKDTKTQLQMGQTVVFDSTASSERARKDLIKIAREVGAKVHLVWIRGGMERALEQNELRNTYDPMRYVPPHVLERMNESLEKSLPTLPSEGFDSVNIVTDAARYVKVAAPEERTSSALLRPEHQRELLNKWMSSKEPASLIIAAAKDGSLAELLPDIASQIGYDQNSKYHNLELFDHTMAVLHNISRLTNDPTMRWAALLHDVGKPASAWVGKTGHNHYYAKPIFKNGKWAGVEGSGHETIGAKMAEKILREYGVEPAEIRRAVHLIRNHMFSADIKTPQAAKNLLAKVGDEYMEDLLTLRIADHNGKAKGGKQEGELSDAGVDRVRRLLAEMKAEQNKPTVKLSASGNDIVKALGVKPGPKVGELIKHLQQEVASGSVRNERKELIAAARSYLK